jgi:RNA polymerase sigma-70 factor (ECF subfamily)
MMDTPETSARHPSAPRHFATTNWSLVRQAGSANEEMANAAKDTLCNAYWYPVYAYIRARSRTKEDAEDLTQGFFLRLLRVNLLAKADAQQGRLRNYLLGSVKHFLISEHAHAHAKKRGGDAVITSFDAQWAENAFGNEPVDEMTPERLYQRRWALTVLEFAFDLLREEHVADGRHEEFERFRPLLGFTAECGCNYAEMSAQTGVPVGTLKSQVHRMRKRWKELLRQQVALTLGDPTEENIRDELRELLDCV